MNTLVSIIVPCYNQARFLNESLQSVLNQTYTNWECIVVNDGSSDNSEEVINQWVKKDSRFKYLCKKNGGPSSARNSGIRMSSGSFILPLDADDYLSKDYLFKVVPELLNNEYLGIVSCYTKFFKGDLNNTFYDLKPKGTNWKSLMYVNQLVATSLYRKQCWEAVGGYDEKMVKGFEDWEFWLAITKQGWDYKIIDSFLFFYRKAKVSRQTESIKSYLEISREYIFKKHKELYIKDFDNCLKVLFYEINTHKSGKLKVRESFEYKLGKFLMKPYNLLKKIVSKP
ncbi:glycosyltransferase family 2 protein [Tamlana agarivorans]|uniref:Glycosyltransferase family 2 protein n=1 Tax=Pseudotamlana agarivorans TaxID=481183 RepID=A0ACC5UCS1_9FLAO|nr:glycosyltransferase family A protein [Tamlana agarivorans]MBU2952153.1 glycosyltransferase family 2 protein [Tamlana agarivorans]